MTVGAKKLHKMVVLTLCSSSQLVILFLVSKIRFRIFYKLVLTIDLQICDS